MVIPRRRTQRRKQKLVTVISTNYVEHIVPGFLKRSFEIYCKKDFAKKAFQVSVLENTYATAGVVLTVLGIEAYRNRIYYLEKQKVGKNLARDISTAFKNKSSSFLDQEFEKLLTEVFILRDVIVHNHIYEVDVFTDSAWEMLGHRQKLLEGYGDERKRFGGFVTERTRKTKSLGFNVQPAKVGFEDLFTLLVIYDLFIGVSNKLFPNSYVPFHFSHKLNGSWINNLSTYLSYFYNQIPSEKFIRRFRGIRKRLGGFEALLPDYGDYFLSNTCPKCKELGFHQPKRITRCDKCGFEIKLAK